MLIYKFKFDLPNYVCLNEQVHDSPLFVQLFICKRHTAILHHNASPSSNKADFNKAVLRCVLFESNVIEKNIPFFFEVHDST